MTTRQRIMDRAGSTLDWSMVGGFPDNAGIKGGEREEGRSPFVAGENDGGGVCRRGRAIDNQP